MIRTLTAQLLLACYGVIALCGQGLHQWTEGACCGESGSCVAQADSCPESDCGSGEKAHRSCCHTHAKHSHPGHKHCSHASPAKLAESSQKNASGYNNRSPHSGHDCTTCIICLHQSLGQWFVPHVIEASAPTACDESRPIDTGIAPLPILYSQAQPRAPPATV